MQPFYTGFDFRIICVVPAADEAAIVDAAAAGEEAAVVAAILAIAVGAPRPAAILAAVSAAAGARAIKFVPHDTFSRHFFLIQVKTKLRTRMCKSFVLPTTSAPQQLFWRMKKKNHGLTPKCSRNTNPKIRNRAFTRNTQQ